MMGTYDELLAENLKLVQKVDELEHALAEATEINSQLGEINQEMSNLFFQVSNRLRQYERDGRFYDRVRKI